MSRQVQESTPLVDSPVSLSALMGPVAMKDCGHRNDRQVFSETKGRQGDHANGPKDPCLPPR